VAQKLDRIADAASIAELKRIVLQRVAELEIEREREPQMAGRVDSSPLVVSDDDVIADKAA